MMAYVAADGRVVDHEPLPYLESASICFARVGDSRYLLMFGGRVPDDSPLASALFVVSSLYWFNLDSREWGKVLPAPGHKSPLPRVGATSIFNDSKLHIFGGMVQSRVEGSITLTHARSYCTAEIASGPIVDGRATLQVCWSAKDEAYPQHVPYLGLMGEALALCHGHILLLPGSDDAGFVRPSAWLSVPFN